MLTKVSYRTFTSSLSASNTKKSSQNVNFGMLELGEASKVIKAFRQNFVLTSVEFAEKDCSITNYGKKNVRLGVFIKFLEFCNGNRHASAKQILEWLNNMPLRQEKPTFETAKTGFEALGEIVGFCGEHQDLTAGKIFEGSIKDVPLEQMKHEFSIIQSLINKTKP
jgi:hypothetical protein